MSAEISSWHEHRIENDGVSLRVVEVDACKTDSIVLLHGYPESLEAWRGVIPLLAPRHRIIALDLRGYGQSKISAGAKLDLGAMADDVRAVHDHFRLQRVFIAGHDCGAHVARRFGHLHPARLLGVSLIDILPLEYVYDQMTAAQAVDKFWHWVWLASSREPAALVPGHETMFLEEKFRQSIGLFEKLQADGVFAIYDEAFRSGGMQAMFENYRATFRADLPYFRQQRSERSGLRVPTQLIWGAKGNLQDLPVEEIWQPVTDVRETHQLPGCGHFVPEEEPAKLAEHILRFHRELEVENEPS